MTENLLRHPGESLLTVLRDASDRFVASDPGLNRLRHGIRAVVALATTVLVEYAVASLTGASGQARQLHVMLGAVIAMNLATTIRDNRRRGILTTAALAPIGAALGAGAAVLAAPRHTVSIALFVLISFLAVWVRRFGPRWFTVGFVTWQAYFFGQFLHPPVSALGGMLVAVFVSSAWVALLLVTVLYADPEAQLRRTVTALRAQARAVLAGSLAVLDHPGDPRHVRHLRAQLIKTTEVALLFDGQLADKRALPEDVAPGVLRRWIVDLEIGVDEVANAAVDVSRLPGASVPDHADHHTLDKARKVMREVGWGSFEGARASVATLGAAPYDQVSSMRRLASGSLLALDTISDWLNGTLLERARAADPSDQEAFEPVVTLQGGSLPGSVGLATEVATGGTAHAWSPGHWRFTTRQAVQAGAAAALAIVAGELISPQRFYWAAIAAFVTFTGAATTAENVRKAVSRTAGTVLGLIVAVGLAQVTAGSDVAIVAVLLGCIFLAFYVQALSNAGMIFFLTLVLGQLYGLLNTFTEDLLLVRLAETAAGAFAGIVVSYAVFPTQARDTLIIARRGLLTTLATLLDESAELLSGRQPSTDPYVTILELDEAARQLAATHNSLLRPRYLDADFSGRRHRVAMLGACATIGRSLLQAALAAPTSLPPGPAAACRALAAESRRLANVPNLRDQRPARADRPTLSEEIATLLDAEPAAPRIIVRRAQRLADALGLLTPRHR